METARNGPVIPEKSIGSLQSSLLKNVMKPSLLGICLLAATSLSLSAVEPTGDQILRDMSAKLTSARTFSFKATREIDTALLPGFALSGKVRISALVQRPLKFAASAENKTDSRRFVADGNTLTLFDAKKNFYATVPMRKTIDGFVADLDEKYGFTPALAEFALSNPYQEFRRQAQSINFLGRAKTNRGFLGLGGVECDRISLKGKVADAELWIGVKDHLPYKLVATFHRPGHPQVNVHFLTWNLAPKVTPADFIFTPPKGAIKIEMWTTAKMQSARKH